MKIIERFGSWTSWGNQDYVWQQFCNFNFKIIVFHDRTKHIQIKFHFIREIQQYNGVLLIHCSSKDQLNDIFTKPLPEEGFEVLKQKLGICHYLNVGIQGSK